VELILTNLPKGRATQTPLKRLVFEEGLHLKALVSLVGRHKLRLAEKKWLKKMLDKKVDQSSPLLKSTHTPNLLPLTTQ
jgi:hypothetical protein